MHLCTWDVKFNLHVNWHSISNQVFTIGRKESLTVQSQLINSCKSRHDVTVVNSPTTAVVCSFCRESLCPLKLWIQSDEPHGFILPIFVLNKNASQLCTGPFSFTPVWKFKLPLHERQTPDTSSISSWTDQLCSAYKRQIIRGANSLHMSHPIPCVHHRPYSRTTS